MEIIRFYGRMYYWQWYSPLGDMTSLIKNPVISSWIARTRFVIGSSSRNCCIYKEEDQYVSCVYIYMKSPKNIINETSQLMVNKIKLLILLTYFKLTIIHAMRMAGHVNVLANDEST
jgi:hypothetical protein